MNRFVLIGLFTLLGATILRASLIVGIPAPFDNNEVKLALWIDADTSAEILADRKAYYDLEERLRVLTEYQLKVLFGASQAKVPDGYILPVHHHAVVGFSGAGYVGKEESYFIPIANVGGLLVFPYGRNGSVSAVALYLKTDAQFTPLLKSSDYPSRRTWELQRTEALKKQIEEALSKRQ